MKFIKEEEYNNTKLINNIKDEEYKKEIISNGYCVGLLENGSLEADTHIIHEMFNMQLKIITFKLTETLGLLKHKWQDKEADHLEILIYLDRDRNELTNIKILAMDEKSRELGEIESTQPWFTDTEIILEGMVWHKLEGIPWNNNGCTDEIWLRLDISKFRAEVYCGIDEALKNVLLGL